MEASFAKLKRCCEMLHGGRPLFRSGGAGRPSAARQTQGGCAVRRATQIEKELKLCASALTSRMTLVVDMPRALSERLRSEVCAWFEAVVLTSVVEQRQMTFRLHSECFGCLGTVLANGSAICETEALLQDATRRHIALQKQWRQPASRHAPKTGAAQCAMCASALTSRITLLMDVPRACSRMPRSKVCVVRCGDTGWRR